MALQKFLKNKYTRWYLTIIKRAQTQNRSRFDHIYYESHHIILRCMGGLEEVLLTAKEHFICHLLLCRMVEGTDKHKMINALIKMAYSKSEGQHRYTARSFSLVRKLIAEKNSEMFKGIPKSERTKQNMKGRSGTWKREDKHKERMRGVNNPNYGKTMTFSSETKSKISQAALGNKRVLGNKFTAGRIWVNNGKKSTLVYPNEMPDGYTKGRIMKGK